MEVARQQTSATMEQLAAELRAAAPELSQNQRALLLAQIALENDRGRAIYNHNVGNLTVPSNRLDARAFYRPFWFTVTDESSERLKRLHAAMLAGKAPSAFAAYGSLAEGMRAYVRSLRSSFPELLSARTPAAFVQAWRESGYTPDLDVARTLAPFRTLFAEFGGSTSSGAPIAVAVLLGGVAWLVRRRR